LEFASDACCWKVHSIRPRRVALSHSLPVCGGGSLVAGNVGNMATTRQRWLIFLGSRNSHFPKFFWDYSLSFG
jgi:hypothetical protein